MEAIRASFYVTEFLRRKQKLIIHGYCPESFWGNTWHGSKTMWLAPGAEPRHPGQPEISRDSGN
jgi:hypothetical protein